ncbi:MAG: energy transducer TonB [Verrucomicrobiota bacterium JB022]|nr:energy transducer TonB [Verrucomicrobiota bacterium JB022]
MKTLRSLLFAAACLLGTLHAATPEGFTPPKLQNADAIRYPDQLTRYGIFEGSVVLQLEIDSNGSLTDWLALAATHEGFVDHLRHRIGDWRFKAAREDGEPVVSGLLVRVDFRYNDVISLSVGEMAGAFINSLGPTAQTKSRVAKLTQLDQPLEPLHVVEPQAIAPQGSRLDGHATVSFYVDEQGHVRLPVVTDWEGDLTLISTAYTALLDWRFEPPTINGRPTIVQARQRFNFSPVE